MRAEHTIAECDKVLAEILETEKGMSKGLVLFYSKFYKQFMTTCTCTI